MNACQMASDSSSSRIGATDRAVGLREMLEDEAAALAAAAVPAPPLADDESVRREQEAAPGFFGLALSGGGIRSATFSLGVLQALAQERKLATFHYLSTVSGGGYIGGWLTAWIRRAGMEQVQNQLGGHAGADPDPRGPPTSNEPPEVTWLRRYSNYLAPRIGLFSQDSLTLLAIWLRNVALNLVVVLSFLALLFLTPLALLAPIAAAEPHRSAFGYAAGWAGAMFLAGIAFNLWGQGLQGSQRQKWLISAPGVLLTVMTPAVISACLGTLWLFLGTPDAARFGAGVRYVLSLFTLVFLAWLIAEVTKIRDARKKGEPPRWGRLGRNFVIYLVAAALAAAACFGLAAGALGLWHQHIGTSLNPTYSAALKVSFGPPLVLFGFGLGGWIFTGIVGRVFYERSREWWSRLNAWLMTIAGGWLIVCFLAFFALPTLNWLAYRIGAWMTLVGSGWIASLLTAILVRRPAAASPKVQHRTESIANVGAVVFVAGLVWVVAAGASAAVLATAQAEWRLQAPTGVPSDVALEIDARRDAVRYEVSVAAPHPVPLSTAVSEHMKSLDDMLGNGRGQPSPHLKQCLLVVAALLLLFGWRVDVNKFSLHNMYKNRLVRCYLGASNQRRRDEQPFTGLDDEDDTSLGNLVWPSQAATDGGAASDCIVQRPLHIINTALNISQGSNLAWQERKAASFVFTPLHCGYSLARTQGDNTPLAKQEDLEVRAYRPTREYAGHDEEERGFTLGMAMATSGAAVSPNMGRATKPALAFLLTLFNLRLGRWSSNPARSKWRKPSPRFGLFCLLQELFGHSNETRNFVYLSDGGHFDNLGLYELVRRRCTTIVVVDAGADPDRKFGDLAAAIRKCRVDLGVEIEFGKLDFLRGDNSMRAEQGFIDGEIRYGPGENGRIILIKPTLRRMQDEPADVLTYAARNPGFPQQSTGDQFFDESQFESYRRLGEFIGTACLQRFSEVLPVCEPQKMCPGPPVEQEAPTFYTRLLMKLLRKGQPGEGRKGRLVDGFVVLSLATIVAFLLLGALSPHVLPVTALAPCWTTAGCRESAMAMLAAAAAAAPLSSPLFWWLQSDNLFILLYSSMIITGLLLGTRLRFPGERERPRFVSTILSCGLVLLAALADYSENALVLGGLGRGLPTPEAVSLLAAWTSAKWWLVSACLIALASFLRPLRREFGRRWHGDGA